MTVALPVLELPRRQVVLRAVIVTGSRRKAAAALGISEHTVRGHLARLYAELGVRSALEAARELGWIDVP